MRKTNKIHVLCTLWSLVYKIWITKAKAKVNKTFSPKTTSSKTKKAIKYQTPKMLFHNLKTKEPLAKQHTIE
jgi:hypothetical protein